MEIAHLFEMIILAVVGLIIGRWSLKGKINDLEYENRATALAANEILARQRANDRTAGMSDAELILAVGSGGPIKPKPESGSAKKPG